MALVTAGVVVLLFVAYELVGTNITEQHFQSKLAKEFRHSLTGTTFSATTTSTRPPSTRPPSTRPRSTTSTSSSVPTRATRPATSAPPTVAPLPLVPPGNALDHLVVPAIGVDRYVVQGVSAGDLQMGPGHYPGTPLPGQAGNVAIAGHRTTFGAPFFELNQLVRGDLVYLTDTGGNTWVYRVQHQWVVSPSDVAVVGPTSGADLTLTTCNPRFEATSRLIVRAALATHYSPRAKLPMPLPSRQGALSRGPSRPLTTLPARGTVPATRAPTTTPSTSAPSTTLPRSSGPSSTLAPRPTTTAAGSDNPTVGPALGKGSRPGTLGGGGAVAWTGAIVWGALVLAAWVAFRVLASRRRGRGSAAVVIVLGALVCLIPLWFAFENMVNLLPSNI